MHLKLLEGVCTSTLDALSAVGEDKYRLVNLSVELEGQWDDIALAAQAVHDANRTTGLLQERGHEFLHDVLARRAAGKPKAMSDAKEAREQILYTCLSPERQRVLFHGEEGVDNAVVASVEQLLQTHFRTLREVFRQYATSSNGGMALDSLLRFYQDCKLQTKGLRAQHVELIFWKFWEEQAVRKGFEPQRASQAMRASGADNVTEGLASVGGSPRVGASDSGAGASSEHRYLTPSAFVDILIQCIFLRCGGKLKELPTELATVLERNLTERSQPRPEGIDTSSGSSFFQKMAHSSQVREVMKKNEAELRQIFDLYAAWDVSTIDALQTVHTMNLKEFHKLLTDCDLLDDTLTVDAMKHIFQGIQQGEGEGEVDDWDEREEEEDPECGLNDDDEMAFFEFTDGLIMVAAFKRPDPFTPLAQRVDAFVLDLFRAMRKYWSRKRVGNQVDTLLNALHKKVGHHPDLHKKTPLR
jgi:hypothetical protein